MAPWQFNSGWPISLTTSEGASVVSSFGANLASAASQTIGRITQALSQFVGATDTDSQYVNGLKAVNSDNGSPTYMGAVSPWFFTHYGADTYNKNVSSVTSGRPPSLDTDIFFSSSSVDLLRRIAPIPHSLGEDCR